MKKSKLCILSFVAIFASVSLSGADIYNDAVGELHDGSGAGTDFTGFGHLDIASVEVMNDATDISFTINLNADITVTDWGKYMIGIDSEAGGDPVGNGWGRPISMSSGMDYWIASWVDSGGGSQVWSYDGAVWGDDASGIPAISGSSVTLSASLTTLGLSPSDTIVFDVFSSGGGGGDSAIDALSDAAPTVTEWSDGYTSTSSLSYTVIPEPATIGLLGMAGISMLLVRRRLFV